jgi:hypothetical protein
MLSNIAALLIATASPAVAEDGWSPNSERCSNLLRRTLRLLPAQIEAEPLHIYDIVSAAECAEAGIYSERELAMLDRSLAAPYYRVVISALRLSTSPSGNASPPDTQ